MNESVSPGFCVNCGQSIRVDAKFCVNCGTPRRIVETPPPEPPRVDAASDPEPTESVALPADHTIAATTDQREIAPPPVAPPPVAPPPVAPPVITSRPPAPKPKLLDRKQKTVLGVGVAVVVVGAAAVLLFAGKNDHSAASAPNSLPPTTVAPAVVPPPTAVAVAQTPTTIADLSAVASRLDAELRDSAAQVTELKRIIAGFDPGNGDACKLSATSAAAQTGAIIDKRKAEVAALDTLATANDATARQLVSLLQTAIDLSLQSDYSYQNWMTANTISDPTSPCRRVDEGNWQAAQDMAPRAGQAKKDFAAAYNRVASGLGLRADWMYTDF